MAVSKTPINTKYSDNGEGNVGVFKKENGYEIITPYGFYLPDVVDLNEKKHSVLLKKYAACISKALGSEHVRRTLADNQKTSGAPIAALKIIIDYIQSGPYKEIEREYIKATKGRINFKKTIKEIRPTITNGEPVYTEFITSHTKIIDQDLVAVAQANVINHFMKNGGEILFGSFILVPEKEIELNALTVNLLLKAKANSFNSRKQQLIQWIIDYIRGAVINEEKGKWQYSIVASSLWEEMIDACYSNQKIRNKTLYGSQYKYIEGGMVIATTSKTQHDTIFENEKAIIIIDAKMYENVSGLVERHLLDKQFGYFAAAREKNPSKKIFNILIKPQVEGETPGYQGYFPSHAFKMGYDKDDVIIVYTVDFMTVLDAYYYGRKLGPQLLGEFDGWEPEATEAFTK